MLRPGQGTAPEGRFRHWRRRRRLPPQGLQPGGEGLKALKPPDGPAKQHCQHGALPPVGHCGPPVKGIALPLPEKPQGHPLRTASGGHFTVLKFIGPALPLDVNTGLQSLERRRRGGTQLVKGHKIPPGQIWNIEP